MKSNHSKRNVIRASIFLLFILCCFWFLEINRPWKRSSANDPSGKTLKATGKQQVSPSNVVSNVLQNYVPFSTNLTAAIISITTNNQSANAYGQISASALEQINALEAEKSQRTPIQLKIDSQLLYADKMRRGVPIAKGVVTQRVDLDKDDQGRILVDIKADVTEALLQFIESGGGKIINSFPKYNAIRAGVPLAGIENLAARTEVGFVKPAVRAMNNVVDSEGDYTHQAYTARTSFGVNGTGVKIGVLSDSVDYLGSSQIAGLVTVLSGQSGTPATGEGTAMLEIVHDLAPGAQLYFATALGSEANFANNIQQLQAAGCNIIVDDELYNDESPFQDGIVAKAVNAVTANGVLYFSSANNSGNKDDGTSGTWEGDFSDGGLTPSPLEAGRIHNFATGINANTCLGSGPGGSQLRADLFWSDPLGASTNDYDLYVLNSSGTTIIASSLNTQNGSQDSYESVGTIANGELIVIVKFSGAGRFLHLSTGRGLLSVSTQGSTRGHDCATNAFGVAATDANNSYPYAFTGGAVNPVETYSSDGPRRVFFQANGTPITPGNFSSTGGAVRQKPDITAADDITTDVPGFAPFTGTSAAAPHAAAIAALLKSSNTNLTPSQIRGFLTGTALDIMSAGTDRDSGAGIVMALAALQAAPHPDLTRRTDSMTNTSPHAGDVVTASITITNQSCSGGSANAGAFHVGFYWSSDPTFSGITAFYEAPISSCPAKGTVPLNQNITIAAQNTPGTYYLGYKINDEAEVSECNENNNGIFYWTITVLPPPQPDLTKQTDSLNNLSPHAGNVVTTTITITNQSCSGGSANAGAFHVGFYWSTSSSFSGISPFNEASVTGCAANGTVSLTNNITIGAGNVPGTYYLGYKINDENEVSECNGGNNGIYYWTVTVIPDTTPPTVNITSPTSGQRWSNALFNATGTAGDNVQVSNVWYQLNGLAWSNALTANAWTNWSATVNLLAGTNSLQAYAVDSSGNVSTTNSVSFDFVVTNQLQIRATGFGTVSPNYSNAWLEIGRNYSVTSAPASGFVFTNWLVSTNWIGGATVTGTNLHFMMQSNLTLQANFLDVTKPTLSITNPTVGQRWSNVVFMARGTATDNWQVASVQYQLNGGIWTYASGTTNWSASLTLTPGTNMIVAYATDTTGNNSATNSVGFDFVVTNQLQIRTAGLGTVSPNYSNAWLEIGRNYSITSAPATGFVFTNWLVATNWIGGATVTANNLQFMMQSNLTLTASFVETSKPTLTIIAPTSGQHMTNALATGIGTASDNWQISNVWYQLNNGAWNLGTTTNSFTNWTTPVLTLVAGTNSLKAFALNLGGIFSLTNSVSFVSSNTFLLRLSFTNALPMTTNGLVFNLQLSTGLNGHIQISTNLTGWTTLTNFVGTNSTITFCDPAATNSPSRFYRAVIP